MTIVDEIFGKFVGTESNDILIRSLHAAAKETGQVIVLGSREQFELEVGNLLAEKEAAKEAANLQYEEDKALFKSYQRRAQIERNNDAGSAHKKTSV